MIFKKHKTQKPYSDYSAETMEHKMMEKMPLKLLK